MKFKQASWAALIAGAVSLTGVLSAQVEITQQPEGVTVKTATDTLHLTVCGATSSNTVSIAEPVATLIFMMTRVTHTTTRRASTLSSPSTGTNPRRASPSARAPVVIPACQQGASSTLSL